MDVTVSMNFCGSYISLFAHLLRARMPEARECPSGTELVSSQLEYRRLDAVMVGKDSVG
ncbi:hypothetical protein [Vibrio sinaloensis]|nr:hypothetical protein [Vibrio sinaloensis]